MIKDLDFESAGLIVKNGIGKRLQERRKVCIGFWMQYYLKNQDIEHTKTKADKKGAVHKSQQ